MPHVWKRALLALELRWHHVSIDSLSVRRSAVLIVLLILIIAAIEVGGSLVLIWTAVLRLGQCRLKQWRWAGPLTYVYLVIRSLISLEEYS